MAMDKLLNDLWVRRTAQATILSLLTTFIVMNTYFVFVVYCHMRGLDQFDGWFKESFLEVVYFPFQSEFGSFIILTTGIIPLVFSSVCFVVDATITPFKLTAQLNHTGHACFLLLCIGIMVGLITTIISNIGADDVSQMLGDNIQPTRVSGDDALRVAARSFFNSILAFQIFYALHLVGAQK